MALLSSVLGFSALGFASRVGQLAIQRRNPLENLGGHAIAMAVFGYGGYWAYKWDIRAAELIAAKRAEIASRRTDTVDAE